MISPTCRRKASLSLVPLKMHTAPQGRAQLSKWREAFARAYYTHWAVFMYVKEAACAKSHPSCGWTLAFMQRMKNKQQEESARAHGGEQNKAITRANSLKTMAKACDYILLLLCTNAEADLSHEDRHSRWHSASNKSRGSFSILLLA